MNHHPWELSKSEMALSVLNSHAGSRKLFIDFGAGAMYFAARMAEQWNCEVFAADAAYENNDIPIPDSRIKIVRSLDELPSGRASAVALMDVMEHVEHNGDMLRNCVRLLEDGGCLYVTVPAFAHLFSQHDVFLKHLRRYDRKTLLKEFDAVSEQLELKECFYFYASLYVLRLAAVIAEKCRSKAGNTAEHSDFCHKKTGCWAGFSQIAWAFPERHWLTIMLKYVLNADFMLCRFLAHLHLTMPGLSVCLVYRKLP
ncbi:MAG: methyltransferase domain-containing protein [Elusimicrobiales bacterium]